MSGGGGGSGQIFNIGKSKAKLLMKNRCKTTFKDVAGLEGAKEEIRNCRVSENPEIHKPWW
jgi:cell division protease FtsH